MIANFDINQIMFFPFKDEEARKNFLIGTLVYFASFIIPIVPLIFVMGYTARILRAVTNGEPLRMPAWDDWESLLKDGLYMFGIRFIYMLPLFAIMLLFFFGMTFLPLWLESNPAVNDQAFLMIFPLMGIFMVLFMPISLALGMLLPAAEAHTIINNDFAAGFRIREWWAIFRANWGGFVLAWFISLIASFALTLLVQIAMITIVLICILPLVMPAISLYVSLIMYAAFAQAYKDGKEKVNAPA